jgi:hypothetical protein
VNYAIINIEIKIFDMPSTPCPSCVVALNQQQEQNISHHNNCQDLSDKHSKTVVKNCTVVENGRVVVKPLQPIPTETFD